MTTLPLVESLTSTLPAKWTKGAGQIGSHGAYLDVCQCRVWVMFNPAAFSGLRVGVVEDGVLPVRVDYIIDAVVECVRRAVHAERVVHAFDVPPWAHAAVVKTHGSILKSGPARVRYEALVREIGEVTP